MKRFALVCPLLFALACGGGDDPKRGASLGDGSGNGSGDGDGDDGGVRGSGMSGDGCEEHIVKPTRITPDMLIVLDRSGSMKMGGVNRWDPSVMGLESIVDKLQGEINFGLMTFPSRTGDTRGSGDTSNCAPGEIDVPVAANNAGKITSFLGGIGPNGRTPTAATLQNVLKSFTADSADPDQIYTGRYVMLVTDGQPNCSMSGSTGGGRGGFGGGSSAEPQAVDDTVAAVQALAAAGIPTYVLGYDTQNDPALRMALDRMAVAGDTGDTAHRPINDQASLAKEFEQIAGGATSCDYLLDNVQQDPKFVRVELDGQTLNYDDPNGWRLRQDNRTVSLQGSACDTLRSGVDHEFRVTVECVQLF